MLDICGNYGTQFVNSQFEEWIIFGLKANNKKNIKSFLLDLILILSFVATTKNGVGKW